MSYSRCYGLTRLLPGQKLVKPHSHSPTDMNPWSQLRSEQRHYEERITTQNKMRAYKGASSILSKRNDVTLNLESQSTSGVQVNILTQR